MTAARIMPGYEASVAEHASVEAIEVYLTTARADRRKLDRHIAWLEVLLADRESGAWATRMRAEAGEGQ